ncbi:dual specificity protein phosphatase 22-B isoform X2 [Brachyhypopomus gauderio]|uniref:dual specificity protein phosphatase 22-B isoform X2 n=1 Tax=Brachyhypopomus gauderio TaxID=698409 RepID=UPI004042B007
MGNGINKILPDLYLGNFKDARDREQLARNNITHILSIHDTAAPILQGSAFQREHHIHARVSSEGRGLSSPLVSLSLAGVSRSVTLVVAYIMTVTSVGWQDALAAVRVVRPCAGPNPGFQKQLQEFENTQAPEFREWIRKKYKDWPFDDEEHIRNLLTSVPTTAPPGGVGSEHRAMYT